MQNETSDEVTRRGGYRQRGAFIFRIERGGGDCVRGASLLALARSL
jgi:hypothetical protein